MANKILVFVLVLLPIGFVHAYEVETHRDISDHAARVSNLQSRLPDLGLVDINSQLPNNTNDYALNAWIFSSVYCFNGYRSRQRSVLDLIKLGAFCEDTTGGTRELARYTNHFYDPEHNEIGFLGIWPSSLTWGLETSDIGAQNYSYKDARDYFYKGLTLPTKSDRDDNLSKTFRTIGHVMHLVQDLAQPQHVRMELT